MGMVYRHTQVSRVTVGALAIAWAAALFSSLRISNPILVVVVVLVGCLLILFSTLTVVVRDQVLDVFFGPGLIRRHIPLRRIHEVRVVTTPWHYGWGIRLTPTGWLWNVSGLGGVELQFDDGHRFRIGSDEPRKLAEVLLREIRAA